MTNLTKPQLQRLGKLFRNYKREVEPRKYLLNHCFMCDKPLVIIKGPKGEVLLFCNKDRISFLAVAVKQEANISPVRDYKLWQQSESMIEKSYMTWAKDQVRIAKKLGLSIQVEMLIDKVYCMMCGKQVEFYRETREQPKPNSRPVRLPICNTCYPQYIRQKKSAENRKYRNKKRVPN